MTLAPGTRLGPYEIVATLGEGGMGEVYRAKDTRLGRDVAVKVLPAAFAEDRERLKRFELEAQAASALNHPNILTIFDVGVESGTSYLVTELLEGRTLREVIASSPASERRAIDWTLQIAHGLAAAHEKGILHRDLKPENVFLTRDDRIKILDFGLAKLTAPDAEARSATSSTTVGRVTEDRVLLGTMGYMAPEQIRGERVDQRADLFAVGCILFELVTGKSAFGRRSAAETIAATLTEAPARVPASSARLERVLARCLAKNRDERVASAARLVGELEVLADLDSDKRPAARRPKTLDSVAVLPFLNESADPDIAYLSEGIAESLLDALTRLPSVRVLARSTVMRFQSRVDEPIEVGRELGVRAVVTGRLRQRGDDLRITCELVRVEDGVRLWGRQYERPLSDLQTIRDEIGEALTDHLRGKKPSGKPKGSGRRAQSAPAYQAYLRGRYAWNRWTADSMRASIRHYDEAIALDPTYALAWAGLADAWAGLGQTQAIASAEAFPRSKAAAQRALELDDQLAEAHASLGFVRRFWDWDWSGSEIAFRRALELAPSYSTAHRWYGHLFTGLGRHDEALAEVRLALELDPLSLVIHTSVGDALFYARRYEESMVYYRRALDIDSEFFAAHSDLARSLEYCGRTPEAVEEYERAIRMAGNSIAGPSAGLANVLALAGRREEAREMLTALSRRRSERYVSPWALASIHARLDETDAALTWLERAYDEHDSTLVWLKVHPRFDALRDEPRFKALLGRMNL